MPKKCCHGAEVAKGYQCVCFVVHVVYTFTSSAKREYTVHLEVKRGGGVICNIAAMILKVLQVQSSVGEL